MGKKESLYTYEMEREMTTELTVYTRPWLSFAEPKKLDDDQLQRLDLCSCSERMLRHLVVEVLEGAPCPMSSEAITLGIYSLSNYALQIEDVEEQLRGMAEIGLLTGTDVLHVYDLHDNVKKLLGQYVADKKPVPMSYEAYP